MKKLLSLLPWLFLFWGSRLEEAVLFLLAVAIHEGGHVAFLFLFRVPIESFSLSPFGAEIRMRDPYLPYRKEILISLAGPAAGLLACGGMIFILRRNFSALPVYFFFCNLFLSVFNLLPAAGLDGGRAFFSFLCQIMREDAAKSVFFTVHGITVLLLLAGGLLFLRESANPSLLLIALSLAMGEKEKKPRKSRSFFA